MRWGFVLIACLLATPSFADGFALRVGDERFVPEALEQRLSGQTVTFFDDGESLYYPDGRYSYTYANNGGTAYGYWRITPDAQVCIAFVNGFSRCDLYVMRKGQMILLDEKGDRYPVRP